MHALLLDCCAQVTATLVAAAVQSTPPPGSEQQAGANDIIKSLKQVLDVNSQQDYPVSITLL